MRLRSRPLFADAAVGGAGNVFQFVADSLPVPQPANVVHPLSSANGYVVVACSASAALICASDRHGVAGVGAAGAAHGRERIGRDARIELVVAGDVVADQAVFDAVERVALPPDFLGDDGDLRRRNPSVAGLHLRARERIADRQMTYVFAGTCAKTPS